MLKLLKTLLLSLLALIAMIAIAVTAAFLLIDPSRYRPALESVFASQTGLQLQIAGEIDWSFQPVFGLSLHDLRLRNPDSPMELASLSELTIKVAPRALVEGQLELQEFLATGLHINWLADEAGRSNWQRAGSAVSTTESVAASAPVSAQDTVVTAAIRQISIRDASVDIQDRQRGLNTHLSNLDVSSSNSNLGNRPFPIELSFEISNGDAGLNGVIDFSTLARVDIAAGSTQLDDVVLKLNPMHLSGAISIDNFRDAMTWRGTFDSNTFPLSDFLDLYVRSADSASPGNALPESFDPDTDQFSLSAEIAGNQQQIEIPQLTLSLDQMRVDATATYTAASAGLRPALSYSIAGNALDLNRYTQHPQSNDPDPLDAPLDTSAPAEEVALPVDLIQSMNIEGRHSIASLAIAGVQFTDINALLSVRDGVLNLDLRPTGFHGGQLTSAITFDTRQNPPSLTSILSARNVDVAQLALAVPAVAFAQGQLNLESIHSLRGSTVKQLLGSITGSTSFSLNDNAIDIGIVKQVFSAISVLSPAGSGDLAQQWPDVVQFGSVEGSLSFTQGIAQNQQFNLSLDNFEIAATGGIDLTQQSFDYAALLTVYGEPAPQTIPVAPLYQGIGWPVQCIARFDAQYSQFCGPDFGRVRDLFVQISRNEVQRRVQDAVTDQVPADLQDAARGLLDRLVR